MEAFARRVTQGKIRRRFVQLKKKLKGPPPAVGKSKSIQPQNAKGITITSDMKSVYLSIPASVTRIFVLRSAGVGVCPKRKIGSLYDTCAA